MAGANEIITELRVIGQQRYSQDLMAARKSVENLTEYMNLFSKANLFTSKSIAQVSDLVAKQVAAMGADTAAAIGLAAALERLRESYDRVTRAQEKFTGSARIADISTTKSVGRQKASYEDLIRTRNSASALGAGYTAREKRLALEAENAVRKTTARSFALNQALFTLRRYAFYATLGVTALGFGLLKWGYNYAVTIQQSDIAFKQLLHTTKSGAHAFVQTLFDLAADAQFSFEEVTDAARKFIAQGGLTAPETRRAIRSLADNFAAMGVTAPGSITRATLQLSHMLAIGRLTGDVLRNLNRDNISMSKALQEQLGLNAAQVKEAVSKGLIDSRVAMAAWEAYVGEHFKGMAHKITYGSIPLLWTSFRDFAGKTAALLGAPVFAGMLGALGKMTDAMKAASKEADKTKGNLGKTIDVFDKKLGAHGAISRNFKSFADSFKLFYTVIRQFVLPGLVMFLVVLGIVSRVFSFFTRIITFFMKHMGPFRWVVAAAVGALLGLFAVLVALEVIMLLSIWTIKTLTLARLRDNAAVAIGTKVEKRNTEQKILAWIWETRLVTGIRNGTKAILLQARAWAVLALQKIATGIKAVATFITGRMIPAIWKWTTAVLANDAAWLANPVTWIVVGSALLAALIVLYFTWGKFHDKVNATFTYIRKNQWWLWWIPGVQMLMTFYYALKLIHDMIIKIKHLVQHPFDIKLSAGGIFKSVLNMGLNVVDPLHTQRTAARALYHVARQSGGSVMPSQTALVGEHGPELVSFGRGAYITPMQYDPRPLAGLDIRANPTADRPIVVNVQLQVNRKVLAEAVAYARADQVARA